jgi:hypothetical protein
MRRRSTRPWNAREGVRGFASAALFYRNLIHRMPMAEDDKAALRAHQDIHQAIGRLGTGDPSEDANVVRAWLAGELRRDDVPGDCEAYMKARLELLALLSEALARPAPRPAEGPVFTSDPPG